jgi:hypothetical protein
MPPLLVWCYRPVSHFWGFTLRITVLSLLITLRLAPVICDNSRFHVTFFLWCYSYDIALQSIVFQENDFASESNTTRTKESETKDATKPDHSNQQSPERLNDQQNHVQSGVSGQHQGMNATEIEGITNRIGIYFIWLLPQAGAAIEVGSNLRV